MPGIALPIALSVAEITGAVVSVSAVTTVLEVAALGALAVAGTALTKSLQPDIPGDIGAQGLASLNAPEVKASVKQSTPFQRIVYGAQRTGGAFAFYRAPAGTGKLYVQHMYSRRKINRITALNINGNLLTFSSSPFDSILAPLAVAGQPDYPGNLRVCFQSGTKDQAVNPLLLAGFSDLPEGWRLPGIANAVYEFSYGADFDEFQALWGNTQIPDVQPELEGAVIYDPRDNTQILPGDPNDVDAWFAAQETWKFSQNAALIAADYAWQKDGLNAGPAGVRWDKIAHAANRADEAAATRDTATTGIYEKRYAAAGVITLDQQIADVFDGIMTASRATMIQGNDGLTWIDHDAPKAPVLSLTDRMLLGGVNFRGFKGRHDLANETTMRFVSEDRDYQLSDGPPLIRADLIAEDGGELALTVSLPFTPSSSTAQRIAKADLEEARVELDPNGQAVNGGATWSGVVNLEALGVREGDCVEIASDICPHWNGLYVVDAWTLTFNLTGQSGIGLSLVGYDPSIVGNWDAADDDQPVDLTDTDGLLAA